MEIGQLVYSKRGRDKSKPFIVLDINNEYLYLVDGGLRKLSSPKKKKVIHVQPTNFINEEIKQAILGQKYLLDSDIEKAIAKYSNLKVESNLT